MLSRLSIRDIVLIDRLEIDFRQGLSALTGETGAGKSILLDALSLALGARGDGGLVRAEQSQGQVTAVFDPPAVHPVFAWLEEMGLPIDGGLILRRVQGADGRTKAFINDQPVSVTTLREAGQMLVEIHGQHDDRAMVEPDTHRQLLDAFGELDRDCRQLGIAWTDWQAAAADLQKLQARIEAGQREADYLRASVEELTALAPEPGEETELAERRTRMMKIEKIATDINDAHEEIAGNASPVPALSSLVRRLERKAGEAPGLLDGVIEALDTGLKGLQNAQQLLEAAMRETDFDPGELERTEERLFALRAASRKYNVAVESLPDMAVKLADDLSALDAGEERLAELKAREQKLAGEYGTLAKALSERRHEAGKGLSSAVEAELPSLKLERAQFIVAQESGEHLAGPQGIDQIEFHVRTNPGTNSGPMMKIASGGELSRFLLALKVALADRGSAPCLVFDEIDTGAGGAVADAIGRRLARLADNVQVLSVTHAPQVAARAQDHFLITKRPVASASDEAAESVVTGMIRVEGAERREEIARMLAGATITNEARAAAEQLIAQTAA